MTPHDDVASGRFQQAEFAADLWQVYLDDKNCADEHPIFRCLKEPKIIKILSKSN